jgi:hypothetical protein
MGTAPAKITDKQTRFVEEYLVDCNATQAAIRAGYSHDSAANIGWENVRKPQIRNRICAKLNELTMTSSAAYQMSVRRELPARKQTLQLGNDAVELPDQSGNRIDIVHHAISGTGERGRGTTTFTAPPTGDKQRSRRKRPAPSTSSHPAIVAPHALTHVQGTHRTGGTNGATTVAGRLRVDVPDERSSSGTTWAGS